MRRRITLLIVSLIIFVVAIGINAQGISPNPNTPPDPNANISFPPPVYFLRGEMQLYGSANLPGMANYFLEYRPLIIAPSPDIQLPEIPWGPISLPSSVPVQNGLLGIWNTLTVADGLYEIRLSVNVPGQDPTFFIVSPLRVENSPSDFALRNIQLFTLPNSLENGAVDAVTTPLVPVATEEIVVTDGTPTATSTTDANVRAGDDTVYGRVGVLLTGTSAPILGISSTGSGWYYIELPNGTRGFISPTVVNVAGDLSNLQRISPPPRPVPTATPTIAPTRPSATQPPTSGADLAGALPALDPSSPSCGVSFNVAVNLTNLGSSPIPAGTTFRVEFQDFWSGNFLEGYTATITLSSPINPGGNFVVSSPSSFNLNNGGGQQHEMRVIIDSNNNVVEINENNNLVIRTFTLGGSC
ncbi:MAG: SH3 domain-containing protein [Anaerolineae bacterium]|nr:SH3 domain-containing protein [Anaerolineae bacterium]